jgi:endoglucanase
MAMAMLLLGPVFFAAYLRSGLKSRVGRLYALAFVCAVVCTMWSYSRGAMTMMPLAYGIVAIACLCEKKRPLFRWLRMAPLIVVGVVGLVYMFPRIVDRFVNAPKASGDTRVELACCAREMIRDNPLFGVGINNWSLNLGPEHPYQGRASELLGVELHYTGIVETVYLLVAAECGLPALAAMLAWFGWYWFSCLRLMRIFRGTPLFMIPVGLLGGLTANYLQSTLEWVLRQQLNLVCLMVMFALVSYLNANWVRLAPAAAAEAKAREERKAMERRRRRRRARRRIAAPTALASIAAAALLSAGCDKGGATPLPPPVSRTIYLDPYTQAFQTDDTEAARTLASEPGYWPVPNGLVDPVAKWKRLKPRVIHTVFRRQDTPFPGYDPDVPSPLFKVNQVGYLPDSPKFAYVGAWLGPNFGPWRPHAPMDAWELVDAATGEALLRRDGPDAPRVRVRDGLSKEGVPFTGEETWELDFSSVTNEGVYFIRIPDVGRSMDFRIDAHAAEEAFRVHMGGLYQKRCGIAKEEPYTHWTAGACHTRVSRGTFAPDEGSLTPKVKWFEIIRDNTDWEGAEQIVVSGGWHDAADYDRRPMHLNIVNDLCAVYLMRPGNFADGQLSIPENSNGIPDILDEADWGLRHLLVCQQPDGGVGTWVESVGHPEPGNVAESDEMPYAVSAATRRSSLMYAAHASLLARCRPEFRAKYLDSATRAWDFAMREEPRSEIYGVKYRHRRIFQRTEIVYWDEERELPSEYIVKAAANLFALTGDQRFLATVQGRRKELSDAVTRDGWRHIPLLFAGERALGYPADVGDMLKAWENGRLNTAKGILDQLENAYAHRAPWWGPQQGWVHTMGFGHSHPLVRAQYLVLAHFLTGDRKYLDAISLANDFHNGCNPQGTTLTSGLGTVYPVAFLDLPSYVDGIAEYVPGITPYRWTYVVPLSVRGRVFGGDAKRASKWPIWRRWGNLEILSVGASEYTVWETIAPAASVTGYLLSPSGQPPPARRMPAKDIRDLPGYWPLP